MILSKYGHAIRKLRVDSGLLLIYMASETGFTSAELSGVECGRKDLTLEIFRATEKFFADHDVNIGMTFREAVLMSKVEHVWEGNPLDQIMQNREACQ